MQQTRPHSKSKSSPKPLSKRSSAEPSLSALRTTAIEASYAAGKILKKFFGGRLKVAEKKNAGLVTNADLAAESAAVRVLSKSYPEFGFLTEESQPILSDSPGRWILDPLDGTTNFVHGFPMFCVSLAAEWRGKIVVGVIYHPLLDHTYVGTLGQGATLNGRKIKVSQTRKISESLLTTGFAYNRGASLHREIEVFATLNQQARAVRRPGSAALDLAYTAQGVFDGFWERNLSPWDVAAGSLILTEAGGKISDFQGNPFELTQREVLASNGALHSKLSSLVSKE